MVTPPWKNKGGEWCLRKRYYGERYKITYHPVRNPRFCRRRMGLPVLCLRKNPTRQFYVVFFGIIDTPEHMAQSGQFPRGEESPRPHCVALLMLWAQRRRASR